MIPSLRDVIALVANASSHSGNDTASSSFFNDSSSSGNYNNTSSSWIAASSHHSAAGSDIINISSSSSSSSHIAASTSSSSPSSIANITTTAAPLPTTYQLLSRAQFFVLCLFTLACFYAALYISAAAVGESTAPLTRPFVFARRLCRGMGKAIRATIRRRRLAFAGVPHEESEEENEEEEYLNINSPAPGAV